MGVYIISDHIQIKLWKKCSVEFFSPAFAKCQTSKMLPTEVNCLIPRKNTLLIFICYQDRMVELCQHKFWPSWPQKWHRETPEAPKRAIFCQWWPFSAIGTSSGSKWVGHWLNEAWHCLTHPRWPVWALRAPKKWHRGAPQIPKRAIFCRQRPFSAISTPNGSKWVGHLLNKIGNCQTHSGCLFWPFGPP